jgi:hypothetical protein
MGQGPGGSYDLDQPPTGLAGQPSPRIWQNARRSATVTAITHANLLILDAHDLRALMDRDARVAERIHATAHSRLGHELVTPRGDMVTEELDGAETDGNAPWPAA